MNPHILESLAAVVVTSFVLVAFALSDLLRSAAKWIDADRDLRAREIRAWREYQEKNRS